MELDCYTEQELKQLPGLKYANNGKSNLVMIERGSRFIDTSININGDNCVVIIRKGSICLNLGMWHGSVVFIGKGCFFNHFEPGRRVKILLSEHTHLVIGDYCMFSYGVFMRSGDPHLIYDVQTHKRINVSKSIYIGDHVWCGQAVLLMKGTQIGSGSIVGAGSVVSGKKIGSNTAVAGNPVKLVRKGVYYDSHSCNAYTDEQTVESMELNVDTFIYEPQDQDVFNRLDARLNGTRDVQVRYAIIDEIISKGGKNRFALPVQLSKASARSPFRELLTQLFFPSK